MKTVIIGGGKGCRAIIKLALGAFLKELDLEIICVADPDPNAPGMIFAREQGIKTNSNMKEALSAQGIKLVVELTGHDEVLENIYKIIPRGIKVFDHTFARIFWDLVNAQNDQARQLKEITELEQNIEQERVFLQSLFDTIPELVMVMDKEKKAIKTNASFNRFTDFTSSEVIGKTCEELFSNTKHNINCQQTGHLLDEVLEIGLPLTHIWRSPPPEETYLEVTYTPIKNKDDEIEGLLGTWHRITEQVILQRKIESAELKFQSFIDSATDWISVKDLEGRYVIVNKIVARSFHQEPEDFIGKTPEETLPEDLAKIVVEHDREVIENDCYQTYDEIVPIDDRHNHFQTVRFPLKDYKGSTIGVCTIMRNITSEIELRDQLAQAGKLAAVGKLAAGVAHEINNPLTGVLAYAEDMIDDLPKSDPHQDDLKVIVRETLRCRDIVRNLLNFARQENPKLEKLDPNKVVSRSLSLVEKLPQFRNIIIENNCQKKIPNIQGDPVQLQQVTLNFMLNAADAMKGKGRIVLATSYIRQHDRCIISVEDNGPGIPENMIDKIFEPFFSTKGTNGLGLAVSWGIVERHHGIIEVDKSESGGALFKIVLPVFRK